MIPRDTYKSIPPAATIDSEPLRSLARARRRRPGDRHGAEARRPVRVEMRLYSVRARQQVYAREYTRLGGQPAALRAHDGRRDPRVAAQAARRGADEADVLVGSRPRSGGRRPVENRDVKEIYIADYDGANQRRITIDRTLNITPTWSPDGRSIAYTSYRTRHSRTSTSRTSIEGTHGAADQGRRAELAAGVLAGRHAHRVHVEPRRQLRDLRHEPRRLGRAAADEPSGDRRHADLVADRHADRVHLGSQRRAADLRRRRRRLGLRRITLGVVRRSRRPGRRRRTTRSRSRRAPGPATTSRF